LIPFNPVFETGHRRPTDAEIAEFERRVTAAGGYVTVRGQRGADIDAACGQLRKRAMQEDGSESLAEPPAERTPETQR
jgi:23S rRNA (adenine2503-C2)-methyltransferase